MYILIFLLFSLADQQSIFSILLQTHFIAPETSSTQAGHHLHDEKVTIYWIM